MDATDGGRRRGLAPWPQAVTVLNVLVAGGFSLAGLLDPRLVLPRDAPPTPAASVFAMYAAARTLPLAAAVLIAVWRSEGEALLALALLAGAVQAADGLVGLQQHDLGKALGPFAIAVLQAWAAHALSRRRSRPPVRASNGHKPSISAG